jgi:hypothetical protein
MKKIIILVTAIIILITGVGLFVTGENQINSQKAELATLQQTVKKSNDQIATLVKSNASANKQIKSLLSAPTPTPIIQVQYKKPAGPNLSACTLEGNFYFCPADNCYYNPNGTQTGVCKVPSIGGF